MDVVSTQSSHGDLSLTEAIYQGISSDGGLFVPKVLPQLPWQKFNIHGSYADYATEVLGLLFQGEPLFSSIEEMAFEAFNFDVPVHSIDKTTSLLNLYQGPTLSFKDFGARFLAACLSRRQMAKPMTMMVATSGDTGSAVASAFYQKPNIRVVVLFPKGQISKRQEHQISCWGDNVLALAVESDFDGCQCLVKAALKDPAWQNMTDINTANSINLGRLLPQVVYYARTAHQFWHDNKQKARFLVPSGNMGNVTAAYWARAMGFPIGDIAVSTNANLTIADYVGSGQYEPRASVETVANAMDVGAPSNFERMRHLYPNFQQFRDNVSVMSVDDKGIQQAIIECYHKHNLMICPHTATAYAMRYQQLNTDEHWIVVGTADPSKFETIIEPWLNTTVPIPQALQVLLSRKACAQVVEPKLSAVTACYRGWFC